MDTNRTLRAASRSLAVALALLVELGPAASGALPEDMVRVLGEVRLHQPNPERRELIEWAVNRYREAGLEVPPVDVYFHSESTGCRGNLGYTAGERIDLCVRLAMEPGPQRIVLHELAHAWAGAHLTDEARSAFTEMRGAPTWNDLAYPWKDRGTEQAAEIIAWGLGDGSMLPIVHGDLDPSSLARGFRMLTGAEPVRDA
jgi:hypothetical protein